MRHLNRTCKLNRTTSHRRCMFANMLKSIITHGKVSTTVPKAKALRRYADQMVTLAKENTLSSRRRVIAELMIRFNTLTPKEQRAAKNGDTYAYNDDRLVVGVALYQHSHAFELETRALNLEIQRSQCG